MIAADRANTRNSTVECFRSRRGATAGIQKCRDANKIKIEQDQISAAATTADEGEAVGEVDGTNLVNNAISSWRRPRRQLQTTVEWSTTAKKVAELSSNSRRRQGRGIQMDLIALIKIHSNELLCSFHYGMMTYHPIQYRIRYIIETRLLMTVIKTIFQRRVPELKIPVKNPRFQFQNHPTIVLRTLKIFYHIDTKNLCF